MSSFRVFFTGGFTIVCVDGVKRLYMKPSSGQDQRCGLVSGPYILNRGVRIGGSSQNNSIVFWTKLLWAIFSFLFSSSHSDCSLEMSPISDGLPLKVKKHQGGPAKASLVSTTLLSRPTATVSPNMVKESTPSSRTKDPGPETARSNQGYDKLLLSSSGSKHEELEKLTSCYSEEGRRASLSLISSMMLSGGAGCDSAKFQSLENTTLSSYVKLLSLVCCCLLCTS